MWIRFGRGKISMGKEGESTPMISKEYNNTGLIRLSSKIPIYYSIVGEGGVWNFPSCVSGKLTCIVKMKDKSGCVY
jgi:hypothetical protein